jgi:hypothetical protein
VTADVHFVQGDLGGPVLVGSGDGVLACGCGSTLIERFRPEQFLGLGLQCGRCGAVTTTEALPAGAMLPRGLVTADPSAEPRSEAMTVPADVAVVGRAEMERLGTLFRPATPPDTVYRITDALLDRAAEAYERVLGRTLPVPEGDPADPFAGVRQHALGWAVRHLRGRLQAGSWTCGEAAATADAALHVAGFLHFVATWSRHPLFAVMAATAEEHGCSLHGLALFAAAHALAVGGNRVGFQKPLGYPERLDRFDLAVGPSEVVSVVLSVFDRFEYPYGRPWEPAGLRAAVTEAIEAAQGRINLRHPGVLLLSPGTALGGFDEALGAAVRDVVPVAGRKNRGLMGVAPVVLRWQATPDPQAIRIGCGLFPVQNRHYSGGRLGQNGV